MRAPDKRPAVPVLESLATTYIEQVGAAAEFSLIMIFFWICDRTPLIPRAANCSAAVLQQPASYQLAALVVHMGV